MVQDLCRRTSPGQAYNEGLEGSFLLKNGHLRRLSDTFHRVLLEEFLRAVRAPSCFRRSSRNLNSAGSFTDPLWTYPPMMRRAVSSSSMSSRMKISICFAQRGTLSATA